MADGISVKFDHSAADAALDVLADAIEELIRPAAQAGAQVFYDAVRAAAPVSKKGHWFHGTSFRKTGQKYWFDAGSLKASIYQVYSKDNSVDGKRATYHISWNADKAPYGYMVEYGTSRAPAHPFLRRGYDIAKKAAVDAVQTKFETDMQAVIARLK